MYNLFELRGTKSSCKDAVISSNTKSYKPVLTSDI